MVSNDFSEESESQIKPITADRFKDTFLIEPKAAVVQGGGFTTNPGDIAQPDTTVRPDDPEPSRPIIPDTEGRGGDDDEELHIKKWTKEERQEMEANLEMMLNFRSIGQSELASWISGEEASAYEFTEEEMNRLARVYAPIMRKWGGKIPDAFWIICAESVIMTKFAKRVYRDRKNNIANKKLANSDDVQTAVRAAAAAPAGERKNYSIDENGYYIKDAKSNLYLKVAKRTTKASFADIKRILEDNELDVVKSVFPQLEDAAA